MPFYNYVCESCNYYEEIFHSIKECDNSNSVYLKCKNDSECILDCKLRRVIGETSFNSFNSRTPEQKREILKKRSKEHFNKELKDKFHQMNKRDYIP